MADERLHSKLIATSKHIWFLPPSHGLTHEVNRVQVDILADVIAELVQTTSESTSFLPPQHGDQHELPYVAVYHAVITHPVRWSPLRSVLAKHLLDGLARDADHRSSVAVLRPKFYVAHKVPWVLRQHRSGTPRGANVGNCRGSSNGCDAQGVGTEERIICFEV